MSLKFEQKITKKFKMEKKSTKKVEKIVTDPPVTVKIVLCLSSFYCLLISPNFFCLTKVVQKEEIVSNPPSGVQIQQEIRQEPTTSSTSAWNSFTEGFKNTLSSVKEGALSTWESLKKEVNKVTEGKSQDEKSPVEQKAEVQYEKKIEGEFIQKRRLNFFTFAFLCSINRSSDHQGGC